MSRCCICNDKMDGTTMITMSNLPVCRRCANTKEKEANDENIFMSQTNPLGFLNPLNPVAQELFYDNSASSDSSCCDNSNSSSCDSSSSDNSGGCDSSGGW